MQIIKNISSLFFITLIIACNKEVSENFIAYNNGNPLNDTAWVKTVANSAAIHSLADSILPTLLSDTIDAETDSYIKFPNNLVLFFPANIFTDPVIPGKIIGEVVIQVFRVEKKSDFILNSKATCTDYFPLESDGALFIKVVQNGKELSLLPNKSFSIQLANSNNASDDEMILYNGIESSPRIASGFDANFTWKINTSIQSKISSFYKQVAAGNYIKGYDITVDHLRWIAIAKPIDPLLNKAKISAYLPLNFTNKNTLVFAILDDLKTVIQLKPDFASRTFVATNIPLQKKIKLLSVSLIGETYYFSKSMINFTGNITPAFALKPEKKELKYMIAELTK